MYPQLGETFVLKCVAGLSLRRSTTWRELGVEPQLLHIGRSQLRWFWHLIRMPPGHLHLEVFRAGPNALGSSSWPGNSSGSPRRSWKVLMGEGMSGFPS